MWLSNNAGYAADKHQGSKYDSIPAEDLEVMFSDVAHEKINDKHGYDKCNNHAYKKDGNL